jgi:hypothetical protein
MPSRLTELLSPHAPSGLVVPPELDRAWSWMEDQGWGADNGNGYFLTPYAGRRQLGIVFSDDAGLTGWFEPGQPGHDRLLTIGEIDGSGGRAVLWLADDGSVQVGALGSEGEAYLLATSATDFLRLAAIGYRELESFYLSSPSDDPDSVEGHAAFRAWVEAELGLEVPEHWQLADPDPFAAWVDATLGR